MNEQQIKLNEQQIKTLYEYADDNMKELKRICYPLFVKIGGISKKDYDDFYSIALDALLDSILRFQADKGCKFKTFLIGNIKRKFITEIRDRNRKKRIPVKQIDSIDSLMFEDGIPLTELIPSDFDVHNECFNEDISDVKIKRYLNKLSSIQKEIVLLLSDGYKASEIREKLHINEKQYINNLGAIQAYENIRELM